MAQPGEELCRQCAEAGSCCCRTEPEHTDMCFPLSHAEWQRLAPYAELTEGDALESAPAADPGVESRVDQGTVSEVDARRGPLCADVPLEALLQCGDKICASEDNSPAFTEAMRKLFLHRRADTERLFPQEGRHLRLRTRKDGACVFLGEQGCRLPRNVRPWYCLLFPIWVQENAISLFQARSCVVVQRAKGPSHGLVLMGMSAKDARHIFSLLQKDWGVLPKGNTP